MSRFRAWLGRLLEEIGRRSVSPDGAVRTDARRAARELHDAMTYMRERDEIRSIP